MVAAFELYATGNFSLDSFAGRADGERTADQARALSCRSGLDFKLAKLLRDPYYVGYVTYQGELISGRHEALISQELFDRVQAMLDERGGRGVRKRRHLPLSQGRPVVWALSRPGRRVADDPAVGERQRRSLPHFYFFCVRKQQHLMRVPLRQTGDAVEAALRTSTLRPIPGTDPSRPAPESG